MEFFPNGKPLGGVPEEVVKTIMARSYELAAMRKPVMDLDRPETLEVIPFKSEYERKLEEQAHELDKFNMTAAAKEALEKRKMEQMMKILGLKQAHDTTIVNKKITNQNKMQDKALSQADQLAADRRAAGITKALESKLGNYAKKTSPEALKAIYDATKAMEGSGSPDEQKIFMRDYGQYIPAAIAHVEKRQAQNNLKYSTSAPSGPRTSKLGGGTPPPRKPVKQGPLPTRFIPGKQYSEGARVINAAGQIKVRRNGGWYTE
jgi:hypothetical protein